MRQRSKVMQIVLEATYKDGVLIPDRSLGAEKEGRRFKIIVVEEERPTAKRDRFFRFVESHSFKLPEDYRFDREELYER
jgi:predicted DNA-binding antitoxin AbrB/MazE fold protein